MSILRSSGRRYFATDSPAPTALRLLGYFRLFCTSHNPRLGGMAGSRGVLRGQAGRRSCCSSPAPPFSLFLGRIMGIRLTAGRRLPARSTDPGRLPRRAPRAGESAVERVAGGGRGVLPGSPPPASPAPPGKRTARVLAGLPADRRRSRAGAGAVARGRGPGRRPRHLPAAAASESDPVALERGRLDARYRVLGGDVANAL